MNKHQLSLLAAAETAATTILMQQVDPLFVFHNLEHTRMVVRAAGEIMTEYLLEDTDKLAILISAWFHDTGFSSGHIEHHESESIRLASGFLSLYGCTDDLASRVSGCIAATRLPQTPLTLTAMILCDADLFHLGTGDFPRMTELLRQESSGYFNIPYSKEDWDKGNIAFLTSHKYFTRYGRQWLEPQKAAWLRLLRTHSTR